MSSQEKNIMTSIVEEMIAHFRRTNNQSLIAKIYGVYTIETNVFETIHILLMQSVLSLQDKTQPNFIFDLKGSKINRRTKICQESKLQAIKTRGHKKVLKDLNFLELN